MKAYIYCRLSGRRGSVNSQTEECIKYCKSKGWEVAETFEQITSSRNMKNKNLLETIVDKMSNGDILVVYSVDRFSRNMLGGLQILEKMERKGVTIYSVFENLTYSTTSEKFNFRNLLNFAEFETDQISSRTKRGKKRKIDQTVDQTTNPIAVKTPKKTKANDKPKETKPNNKIVENASVNDNDNDFPYKTVDTISDETKEIKTQVSKKKKLETKFMQKQLNNYFKTK
ncbi:MAG: recombinase family protein [Dasosvirus sp.]|uniref:Recombinase family protein n=1 Tax=Dasosvirus sp. TaxID=2487764 RepID=A0A3G4ZUY6_9VIRU|nr:MAG: recombinase family protein [Dasosvirus sp.]